jgi:glycosyltransferase involved in cell wall biosynthesis
MLIDSTSFNGNKQYPEWYSSYNTTTINGFPTNQQCVEFLKDIDVLISCELFYNPNFVAYAKTMGVKTVLIFNHEFLDNLSNPNLPVPDVMIQPSLWYYSEMKDRFNSRYLPTPIFEDEFKQARETNLNRSGRNYLFMNGKTAVHDRNGLESLYEALPLARGDFTVTIKAQHDIKKHPDPRLIYDFTNPDNQNELYEGYDALIQPRRYGGQTLSMCEALQSGMPVVMTNISPNNKVLPAEWLVDAEKIDSFMTRTLIDIYSAHPTYLAYTLDHLDTSKKSKLIAYKFSEQYDAERLRPQYEELLKSLQ